MPTPRLLLVTGILASLSVALLRAQRPDGRERPDPKQDDAPVVHDERLGFSVAKGRLLVTLHAGIKPEQLTPLFEAWKAKFTVVGGVEAINQHVLATDHERLPELRERLANHPYV